MCFVEEWLEGDCGIIQKTVTSTTTGQVVWAPDPLRFAINAPFSGTVSVAMGFQNLVSGTLGLFFTVGGPVNMLHRRDYGDLITQQVTMYWSAAGSVFNVYALSYNPNRSYAYDQWVQRQLAAKFGSP